jgi:hypothetical protein
MSRKTLKVLIIPLLAVLALLLILNSCNEEAIEWELDTHRPDLLVVEGVITNRLGAHEVRITRPVEDPQEIPQPVSKAVVAIFDGSNATLLRETSPGIYHTNANVRAVYGRMYQLYILHQGREYYAAAWLVPVQPLTALQYRKVQGQDNWYELELRETEDASMVEIELDWSHLAGFRNQPDEYTHARIVYYTVKSIDVNKMFRPDKERVYFPVGTRVRRTKYSMNPWQEEFVRTLMAETEWRGGYFDVQPGNVQTNLSEGAVGYFSASTVVADSSLILPLNR